MIFLKTNNSTANKLSIDYLSTVLCCMISLFLNTFSEHISTNSVSWPIYNQSLVRRGNEILLGFDVINNWHTELKEMNKDKVGEPFHI